MLETTRRQEPSWQSPGNAGAKSNTAVATHFTMDEPIISKQPPPINAQHDQAYWEAVDRFDMPSA